MSTLFARAIRTKGFSLPRSYTRTQRIARPGNSTLFRHGRHLATVQRPFAGMQGSLSEAREESKYRDVPGADKIPPNIKAKPVKLVTFDLPERVTGSAADVALGRKMIDTWRQDGIFQISMTPGQGKVLKQAYGTSKAFFNEPHDEKAKLVDDQSFAGYIASGEEITDGIADYSEIFTVTKDLPPSDTRVQMGWPAHGPCPWPNEKFKNDMTSVMDHFNESGEKLLHLTALGLGLHNSKTLMELTDDGWHHMRILRFPATGKTNGKGKEGRGIGSHTDYGLLVIASQDEVGGLFIRPPYEGENLHNWDSSAAGKNEDDDKWTFIPPMENVLTVFPGDMMQYLTSDYLPSTPHKVGLNTRERFAFAYFQEPTFDRTIRPLPEYRKEGIHYGTHFTNMFMRNYPERITAKRMREENRMDLLQHLVREEDFVKPKDVMAGYRRSN